MRAPNWMWPRQVSAESGLAIRLGRALHWLFAIAGAAMIIIAAVMAFSAVSSSAAAAQQNEGVNQVGPSLHEEQNSSEANPFDRFDSNASSGQPGDAMTPHTSVLGSYARQDRGADMVLPNMQTPPKHSSVDWALLQAAIAVFVGGITVMLIGRGIRYILSNE
jgi:hypothetical protein